jgi:hypothetical protein
MSDTLQTILADPHWLCIGFQRERRELHFAYCDDARLDEAPFLDAPWIDFDSRRAFPLDAVAARLPPPDARPAPRFILHTSFCCSTLMARCLDVRGQVRVLRELTAFNGLARTRARDDLDEPAWEHLIDSIGWLASRAFEAANVTVNKPSNVMLGVAPMLLGAHPRARAIAMFSDLPAYLVSCAKKGRGARPQLLAMLGATDPASRFASRFGLTPATLGPLELGAFAWHLHMDLLRALDDVAVLDAGRFLSHPFAAVRAAQSRLGIEVDAQATRDRVEREMRRNAKQTAAAYDPARRAVEARLVQEQFRSPIEAALDWSGQRFGRWTEWLPAQPGLLPDGLPDRP